MENKAHEDYALFKEAMVTDPKYTKNVKVAGKQPFTNIDTYYLIEKTTKVFGLYGKEWGLKDTTYEYMDLPDTKLVIQHSTFFFPDGKFPITNSDKLMYKTKNGYDLIDTDIYKKINTNTIAKALSHIGFGTDVYIGKFEDYNYTNEASVQHAVCNVEQQQILRKGLGYYKVDASLINKHFVISTMAELPANKFEEAQALIKSLGESKKD